MPKKIKDTAISFTINQIETLQYALLRETLNDEKMNYSAGFGFGIDTDKRLLSCRFKYEFISESQSIIVLEVLIDYIIEEKSFKDNIFNKGIYSIPKNFATHLAMIAVGTARGILHEKTNGTMVNKFPIPTIDITNSISDDILFSIEK